MNKDKSSDNNQTDSAPVEVLVRARRDSIGQVAARYMRQNGYTFVMAGDSHLLHEIAEAAGLPHRSWKTEKQVLDAIDRSGIFVKEYVAAFRLRRVFTLPECHNSKAP